MASPRLKSLPIYWHAKHLARAIIWSSDTIYQPICKLRKRQAYAPDNFEAFVSGFPRSGNNFIIFALRELAQPQLTVNKACHIPPLIQRSVKMQKPSILTIREPIQSAVSWAIFSKCPLSHAFDYYCQFHRQILAVRQQLVVLDFSDFTKELPRALDTISAQTGIKFAPCEDHETLSQRIFAAIEDYEKQRIGGALREHQTPRPTQARQDQKKQLTEACQRDEFRSKIEQATELYQRFKA